jgi:hypothetical protein
MKLHRKKTQASPQRGGKAAERTTTPAPADRAPSFVRRWRVVLTTLAAKEKMPCESCFGQWATIVLRKETLLFSFSR